MVTGKRDMLRNGREQFPGHLYPESGITGQHIFNLFGLLVKLQAIVFHRGIFIGKPYLLLHPVCEASPWGILVGGA